MAIVQPLVLCRDIGETDDATEMVLVGPFSRVRVGSLPAEVQVCVYAQVYELGQAAGAMLTLRDADDTVLWTHAEVVPLGAPAPGSLHRIVMREIRVALAAPGNFQIVLTVDGGGQARHPLIVSLAE